MSFQKLISWIGSLGSLGFPGDQISFLFSDDLSSIPPFHCSRCHYVWTERKVYLDHKSYCDDSNDKEIQLLAEKHGIKKYCPSDHPPSGVCSALLVSGPRVGLACLRPAIGNSTPCHTIQVLSDENISESDKKSYMDIQQQRRTLCGWHFKELIDTFIKKCDDEE